MDLDWSKTPCDIKEIVKRFSFQVKEEVPQGRVSDTLHVDTGGLVTLTTPNRQATVSVRAVPLPQGKIQT